MTQSIMRQATSASGPHIIKADGSSELFDGAKLEASLRRAGAGAHVASRIRHTLETTIIPGARTDEIYRRAFSLLRHEARSVAARYSLRRAIFEFGPTGHPFENFIAELFAAEGWRVEWRKIIPGRCVLHEVDVYATKEGQYLAAELKYHNDLSYKTDIKTALYVKARFDDIWQCDPKIGTVCPVDHGMLVTNTKFTSQAIQYARCAGIELLGWTYPAEGNLYDRIISAGIYPLTALTSLKKGEKRLLIDQGIVTCGTLSEHKDALRALVLSPERMGTVLAESRMLCEPLGQNEPLS